MNKLLRYIPYVFIGLSSGITTLFLVTIDIWLSINGVSNSVISFFSLCKMPYIFKFLIAPFVDEFSLFNKIPRTKGWIFVMHMLNFLFIFTFSLIKKPSEHLYLIFILSMLVMLCSSIQSTVSYKFQIDNVKASALGFVSTYTVIGYRIGFFISTSCTLIIAHHTSWEYSFITLSLIVLLSSFIFYFRKEPNLTIQKEQKIIQKFITFKNLNKFKGILFQHLIIPLKIEKKYKLLIPNILAIFLIKAPDDMSHKMGKLLILELGFSLSDMATYVNITGIIATILGSFLISYYIKNTSVKRILCLSTILHTASLFLYFYLYYMRNNYTILVSTIFFNNFTGGMLMTAFMSYLYNITKGSSSPSTMYAFFWTIYSIGTMFFQSISGPIVDIYGWFYFFVVVVLIAFLSIFSIILLRKN